MDGPGKKGSHKSPLTELLFDCSSLRVIGALNVAFVPLGDHTGTVQLTCDSQKWTDLLSSLSTETVVMAKGIVKPRPEKDRNPLMQTG